MNIRSFIQPNRPANLTNPDDIDANRRGQITPAQNDRLDSMALGRQGCGTLIAPLVILGFIFFILITSLLDSSGFGWFALIPIAFMGFVLLGFSKGIISWIRNSSNLKADRANGIVRSAVGELTFLPKKGFIAKVNEEELSLSASNEASGLLPGVRYNFYYLPESRFVLSAEQIGQVGSSQVRLALTDILAQANGYSTEDLQSNRNGEVTQSQRFTGLKKLIPGLIFMGVALVFGVIFIFPLLSDFSLDNNLIPLIFVGVFIAIFGAIGFSMILNSVLDINAHVPEVVEGRGSKTTRRKSSGKSSRTVYYYIIGDHEFEIPQKAYPALIDGITYKAYFMPRTKHLLSIEPVSIPEDGA